LPTAKLEAILAIRNMALKKKILVIDDSPPICEYARIVLEKSGYQVTTALDGDVVEEKFKENGPFDLVITDVSMPKKDGIDLLIETKAKYPGLKVVVMSGLGSKGTLFDIAGIFRADATLSKPFTQEELLGAVKGVLGKDAVSLN
jgi:DNA-binding response OmpR family regulator